MSIYEILPALDLTQFMAIGQDLISLRLGFRRNFLSVLHPNLVSSPIKGILEILNLSKWSMFYILPLALQFE
jgi:hypothetical protein